MRRKSWLLWLVLIVALVSESCVAHAQRPDARERRQSAPRFGAVAYSPAQDALSDSVVASLYASLERQSAPKRLVLVSQRDLNLSMDNEFAFRKKDAAEFESLGMLVRGDALANVSTTRQNDTLVVRADIYYPGRHESRELPGRIGHAPRALGPWRAGTVRAAADSVASAIRGDPVLSTYR